MRLFDYIELKTPGYFEIVKLPAGLKQELKAEESENVDDGTDTVEYEAEESKAVEVP
jgi:hypothetical protein